MIDQQYADEDVNRSVQYENSHRGGAGGEMIDLLELAIVHLAHLYGAGRHV